MSETKGTPGQVNAQEAENYSIHNNAVLVNKGIVYSLVFMFGYIVYPEYILILSLFYSYILITKNYDRVPIISGTHSEGV